jgi:uncharacterized membrane protein
MVLLLPVLSILMGRSWMKNPPKVINAVYGYRTANSMKSKETWRYAHQYFGKLWFISGFPNLILSVLAMFLWQDVYEKASIIIIFVQLAFIIIAIIPTELSLKKHFDRNGYPIKQNDDEHKI